MLAHEKHKPTAKVWLELKGAPILGVGGAIILEAIKKEKSISEAARKTGMSYRYAWNYLNKMNKTLGSPVVKTFKGGKAGGGGAELTKVGENLLREYNRVEDLMKEILRNSGNSAELKTNTRNRLKGTVKKIETEINTARIKIEVKNPVVVTALISRDVVDELKIEPGDYVEAIIKPTQVMIAKEK